MKNLYQAYIDAIKTTLAAGRTGVTEDGEEVITRSYPLLERFDPILVYDYPPGLGVNSINEYIKQFNCPNKGGFDYTYGNRIRAYFGFDQLEFCYQLLKDSPLTRRAIITLNDQVNDRYMKNKPCMQFIQFYFTNDRLKCFALFRSHDILSAWFANACAISSMAKDLAKKLNYEGPIEVEICSVIPHIYYKRDADVLEAVARKEGFEPL